MPTYFFHIRNTDTIADTEGTELVDEKAARAHADSVARELMFGSQGMLDRDWSAWSMVVHDAGGRELFSFPFTAVEGGDGSDK
jgi:hypothetical protein